MNAKQSDGRLTGQRSGAEEGELKMVGSWCWKGGEAVCIRNFSQAEVGSRDGLLVQQSRLGRWSCEAENVLPRSC